MKKTILISILLIFIILFIISLKFGFTIGNFKVLSISNTIKANKELENKINEANEEKTNYQDLVSKINANEKLINTVKQEYIDTLKEAKKNNSTNLKTYTKEYIWGKIEEYAKKQGVNVKMNIEDITDISKNIEINIIGPYLGISNFIYELENDFRISNFSIKKEGTKIQIKNIKILEE